VPGDPGELQTPVSTSQMFAEQMESKLDALSQSYLRLLNSDFHHHQEYLRVTNLDTIRREVAQVQKDLEGQAPKVPGDQPQTH